MTQSKQLMAIVGALAVALVAYGVHHVATAPTGSPCDEQFDPRTTPQQTPVGDEDQSFSRAASGYTFRITPKANYRIAARVLHTERYRFGWQSSLSPVDLALGWAVMADPKVDEWISWSQSNRWYWYRWSGGSPYTKADIVPQSANVHIIPANTNVWRAVVRLDAGDIVLLEGQLVFVTGAKGGSTYTWNSSLSRKDTGDRSCEVMFVKRVVVDGVAYE